MAGTQEAKVPDIGGYDDVPVIELLVAVGDTVKADQGLVTLESDKATMEVPAPFAGVVRELKVKVGDKLSEGSVVALIEASNAADAPKTEGAKAASAPAPANPPTPPPTKPTSETGEKVEPVAPSTQPDRIAQQSIAAAPSSQAASTGTPLDSKPGIDAEALPPRSPPVSFDADGLLPEKVPYASPAVRLFARELGVDLAHVQGNGRKGRIEKEDVQNFVKRALSGGGAPSTGVVAAGGGLHLLPWPNVDFSKFGEIETRPLTRIQKISGANLARNWAMIPHVTQHDDADITDLEALRVSLNKENEKAGLKLTMLAFLMKASVVALQKFPNFNASLDASGENLTLKKYFNIGFAADTPNGLVVPVVRDVDKKGVLQIAKETSELAAKARDGKLGPADMSGGCFSISSLGGIGGTAFTPIVNAPEVAILGVSKSSMKPVWDGKQFQPRLVLPLSLSYDHRVIDGAAAARFTAFLAQLLGDMRRATL
ncbi:Dihydrolipoamide acetyltransferase component of pyruvate dehydrogenase complex [Lysobacter dokdonensis DS-58]|uniref:Dihydrolipoamide acetyltransferase component of pyruvate dehydrogenase complex n=1 Tax=Lysobacter dokdonensis DS-58 TaxID=1300345 RepID=A0A0A2WYV4_9GAMM|nr:dihydrolipoyllysine-residue acetyltransferase [Lysobacter dokdonensis]KGQ18149.1 Dihydrolipoamide acetyltransferase component of pyruvate dehydrogenase complex [Lysobacter dokdonensis DS-58]